jgi:hypothetical protein
MTTSNHLDHPNIARLLVLSTKHLDPSNKHDEFILDRAPRLISPHRYEYPEHYGAGFQRALALAATLDAAYIRFDPREPPLKSLPTYGD